MTITDKMLHFAISFLTFSTAYLYCNLLNLGLFWCFMTAFVFTLTIGVTKEVINYFDSLSVLSSTCNTNSFVLCDSLCCCNLRRRNQRGY